MKNTKFTGSTRYEGIFKERYIQWRILLKENGIGDGSLYLRALERREAPFPDKLGMSEGDFLKIGAKAVEDYWRILFDATLS